MFEIKSLGNPSEALTIAREHAPYLERLSRRLPEIVERLQTDLPESLLKEALQSAKNAANLDMQSAMRDLRIAKAQTHLSLAAGDLSTNIGLFAVTGGLSELADISIQSALKLAAIDAPSRDKPALNEDGTIPGLFILAMGKHGAGELNYSSDIDLIAAFDREAFDEDYRSSSTAICVRLIGAVSRIMEDVTIDNYVFRVDWRLRPDPSSTPLAVSTQAAEVYYESVGQNWERAAYIKARAIAGSMKHANEFLEGLSPFIWRKYLDFAAIQDVGSILKQIHRVNRSGELDNPAFDVKLGRGGIREIEFFTQTQQLILGGRDKSLRERETLYALQALSLAKRITPEACDELSNAYVFLRNIEHRVQMLDDEQTHSLPANIEKRAKVAHLSGFETLEDFDKIVRQCRELVRTHVSELFPESATLSSDIGSLVFTGVDNDDETLETISELGFKDPVRVSETIRGWHHGRIKATRTPRARELLTTLTPNLLSSIAQTGEPDIVFARFDDFFSNLTAGVQTLSLFVAEPNILAETCATLGLSSRLATALANKPAILDAMLSQRFLEPLESEDDDGCFKLLQSMLENVDNFELALDILRRFHREEDFRIGCHVLHGRAGGDVAGKAYTNLAIACIKAALPIALSEVERSHGKFNAQIAICGWGKLGGHELSADSDLDLMLIYEPAEGEDYSDGDRALSAESYFAKLTQKLVAALSVPTAEGLLYEVDMQLRPSGKKGPVAVRYSSFENYYHQDAWTWEFQALTRLRPVAGDAQLCAKISKVALEQLAQERDKDKTLFEIVDMREKIRQAHKPRGSWDLKRLEGGIVELEFLTQAYELLNVQEYKDIISANTIEALHLLAGRGIIDSETAGRLIHSGSALHKMRQILAIVTGADFEPDKASNATKMVIARALDAPDFGSAQAILDDARKVIAQNWGELHKKATEYPKPDV